MYIHRIILRDIRNFDQLDIMLRDDWREEPLKSVLLTGPNGSGKTTILRVIAALWENFASWLRLRKSLNKDQQAQRGLLLDAGLAAIELHDLDSGHRPIWLFMAATEDDWRDLQQRASDEEALYVGEVRGMRGRPTFVPGKEAPWLDDLNHRKERLQVGVDSADRLPNLVFLEAETRTIIPPSRQHRPDVYTEALYQWYVTYEARDRWEGHIESMLRNLKVRDANWFHKVRDTINHFFVDGKHLADFDDNLRLQVRFGEGRRATHYIDDLSAGERQVLILIFMASRWLMPAGIVLIDEPDLHLHVSLQRQIMRDLERIVMDQGGQIIVTSHSPTLWEDYSDRQRIELWEREHATD